MSQNAFTPALGRFAPTRFYDHVVALTRERLWRALAAMYVAPRFSRILRPGFLIDASFSSASCAGHVVSRAVE